MRFAIRFYEAQACGSVVQGIPRYAKKIWDTMGHPFEEISLPLEHHSGEWTGAVTILPHPSMESIYVMQPPRADVRFFCKYVEVLR